MKKLECPICGSSNCDYDMCYDNFHCNKCDNTFDIDDPIVGVPPTNQYEEPEIMNLINSLNKAISEDDKKKNQELDDLFWQIAKRNS